MLKLLLSALLTLYASPSLAWIHGRVVGPCDLIACVEAYSLTHTLKSTYIGPLFQLNNGSSTLDIGTKAGVVDLTTWSAFCSGVPANCQISKIYAQIHTTSNDLIPFKGTTLDTSQSCDAPATPLQCALTFALEASTGLPIFDTTATSNPHPKYTITSSDAVATGILGGTNPLSVLITGNTVSNVNPCCGEFGLAHLYNSGNVVGTDFMIGFVGTGMFGVNCATTLCLAIDEEIAVDIGNLGSANKNVIGVVTLNASADTTNGYTNNTLIFTAHPTSVTNNSGTWNVGTHIHLGGGGDLGWGPSSIRDMLITNTIMSTTDVAAVTSNLSLFYRPYGITFP